MKPLSIDVPVIETERLRLRGHRYEDFVAIRDMWADPIVTKYIGGTPRGEEECWLKFLRASGFWVHLGYGFWIIEDKMDGRAIGEVGFGDFKRDIDPPIKDLPEMGWSVAAAYHGKGVASEVVAAALNWGREYIAARPFVCVIDQQNLASVRVAEKCGFREVSRALYHGDDVIVFHGV